MFRRLDFFQILRVTDEQPDRQTDRYFSFMRSLKNYKLSYNTNTIQNVEYPSAIFNSRRRHTAEIYFMLSFLYQQLTLTLLALFHLVHSNFEGTYTLPEKKRDKKLLEFIQN